MDTYGTDIPADFSETQPADIRRIQFDELDDIDFKEPLLVEGYENIEFHNFPHGCDELVPFLLENFGKCAFPVSSGEAVTLSEWYSNKRGRYLKDWHINESKCMFNPPPKLDDWLNDYKRGTGAEKLDFQFLYWGDRGTQTGYHEDVAGTFSWSYNLKGTKKWSFFLKRDGKPVVITCKQRRGQLIFVPSGCFHTVENMEDDTISINQNWFNEHNLEMVVKRIVDDSLEAQRRFKMFDIEFASKQEEWEQLEFITRSNNDLNVGLILNIIEFRLKTRENSRLCIIKIKRAIEDLATIPQFLLFQNKVEEMRKYISE